MKTFEDIIGQDLAKEVLAASLDSGRLHHAWIFHGPAGVGKRTTAEAFGLALLDETTRVEGGAIVSDAGSATRRLVDAGTHPDLHVVTKELARFSDDPNVRTRKLTSIPKEVLVERLIEPASRTARTRSGARAGKVFIVDEAELMNPAGQNALLKTLEEPAPGTVIVLVTSSEERLLPTIRSRCQRVAFTPLTEGQMDAWAEREGFEASGRTREWLLGFAAGSPGRALTAFEGGFDEWASTLDPMLRAAEQGRFDPGLGPTMKQLIDAWAKQWVEDHDGASKDAANKSGAAHLLGLLAERSRRALRDAAGEGVEPARDRVERALAALETIGRAEAHVATNVNLQVAMDNLAAQLSAVSR